MPSVVNPPKGNESPDNLEKFSQVVEKKIRNLEKRKGKIQTLLEQKKGGKTLDADQISSVNSLTSVEANLEQLREFLPQFKTIANEYEKNKKRNARREEAKRVDSENKRARGILSTLHYLSLCTAELKQSLLTGLNGLVLSEKEIENLDGFYEITDTSSASFSELEARVESATQHIQGFLDRKDREAFAGVKYSDLAELFDKLHEHHVFDPDYEVPAPPEEEEEAVEEEQQEEEVEEAAVEEAEPAVEEEPVTVEPTEPATEQEEALLNGEVTDTTDEAIVNFMHDSQLDRSESQLSPHAPEFQPGVGSPDLADGERATFGEFSQDEPDLAVEADPAVMAWSAGPTPPAEEVVAATPAPEVVPSVVESSEPANPWSKSTLDWGNSSLPVEEESPAAWTTPQVPTWSGDAAVNGEAEDTASEEEQPEMKDQTTQKVDEEGFTEQRRRGSSRQRYNNSRGNSAGGYTSYRNNNTSRGSSNSRYNNSSRGSYSRDARGGGSSRGSRDGTSRRGGSSRGGSSYSGSDSRGGYNARGGSRGSGYRGGSSSSGGGYRGTNGNRGGRGRSSSNRSTPVAASS